MSDPARDRLRLRTITVTTRAARRTVGADPVALQAVTARSRELLAELERAIRANGSDPSVLAGIDEARRRLG